MNSQQGLVWKCRAHRETRTDRSRIQKVLAFSTIWLVTTPLAADPVRELLKLTPSRSTTGDYFGAEIDIDGEVAIVSAWGDAEFGTRSGAAYLFNASSGEELFRLTASDAHAGQWFGSDVAISGGFAMVAASSDDEAGRDAGAVYVFDVATGEELYKLIPDDPSGEFFGFGSDLSMDGTNGIIGTRAFTDTAYIFDLSAGEKLFDLKPLDPHMPSDFATTGFGSGVALSGNTAVVGAYIESEFGDNAGAAYVFDATTGELLHKLSASDAQEDQFFGSRSTIAMDNGTIVIGAAESGNWDRGNAYFFDADSGVEQKIVPTPNDDPDNYFAATNAISGDWVILGASNDTVDGKQYAGSAYLYDLDTGELQKFFDSDGNANDHFGISVAIDGNLAIIGSTPWDSDGNPTDAGFVSVFRIAEVALGDVNQDGRVDVADIDDLARGIRDETSNTALDLDDDGVVTLSDHQLLIKDVLKSWYGDSNLDGEFNGGDLVKVFQAGEYEDDIPGTSTWATGDWNADGEFNSGDLVAAFQDGGYERGPRLAANVVPEPTSLLILISGAIGIFIVRRTDARGPFRQAAAFVVGLLGMSVLTCPAQAGVYQWDSGELIPGTEHIVFGRPDVSLDGLALVRADLVGKFFSSATDADLQEADLRRANVQQINGADLTDAIISESWLTHSYITAEQLYSTASYRQNDLKNIAFAAGAPIEGSVDFAGWDFRGQDLSGAWLADCSLGRANTTNPFVGTDFRDANIVGAELNAATHGGFTKEQLYSTASYQSGNLERIGLGQNDLQEWNFSGQDLFGADFNSGRFMGFDGCSFIRRPTNLTRADFTNANLRGAYLRSAELTGTVFNGADLRGAEFTEVTGIEAAHFSADTVYNQWTLFPDDFDPQAAGLTLILSPAGDLNSNGILDAGDIDLFGPSRLRFASDPRKPNLDLNGDSRFDDIDRSYWIHNVKGTYIGDANLDGEFNSGDLVAVFHAGEYEDADPLNSGWGTGDWNGDGEFTSGDLVIAFQDGGYEQGPLPSARIVPEPTSLILIRTGVLVVAVGRRRRPIP